MRVAFELTALQLDKGGTARMIEQILPRLEADPRVEIKRLQHPGSVPGGRLGVIRRGLARELWYLPRKLPRMVAASGADLLHCPSQLVPVKSPVPLVMTLHDAIGWDHPEWLTRANVTQLHKVVPRAVANGAHVITSSDYSGDRLAEALGIERERITTVPLGIDARFTPDADPQDAARRSELGIDRPYVFTVGTLQPRKNLEAAIAAFEQLEGGDHALAIAGARGWHDSDLLARIEASPAKDRIVLLGRVDDDALIALYRGADAFVYPSRYEGFGFPPLEAMACGTPVLSTTNTSLAEAVGDAAIEIDPGDPAQIAAALANLLGDEQLRSDLRRRGLAQSSAFTWDRCRDLTIETYERVLNG